MRTHLTRWSRSQRKLQKVSVVEHGLTQLRQYISTGTSTIVVSSHHHGPREASLRAIEGRVRHKDFVAAFGKMFVNDRKENLSSVPDGLVLAPASSQVVFCG